MSKHSELITRYRQAAESGNSEELRAILASVPSEEFDEFLAELEQRIAGSPLNIDASRLQAALQRSGVGAEEAEQLSILSAGSFADFIRSRMRANSKGADTVMQAANDDHDGIPAGEDAVVEEWLARVLEGDEPDIELSDDAMTVLARAVGSSPDTLVALRELEG